MGVSRCVPRSKARCLLTPPTEPTKVYDPPIAAAYGDFIEVAAAPAAIDKKSPPAINAPDVSEAAVPKPAGTLRARDRSSIVEAGADRDVDGDGIGGRR